MGASMINGTRLGQLTSREVAAQLECLQYAGHLELGDGPRVAVIGSQACTNYGEHIAADLRDGVLTITCPKAAPEVRRIHIT